MNMGTARWREAVPLATVVVAVGLFVMAVVLGAIDHRLPGALAGLTPIALALVGAVILRHRPGNRIGWLLTAGSVPLAALNAGTAYTYHSVMVAPLPATSIVETVINAAPLLALGLLVAVLPQLFPTGAPVSRRWRLPLWAAWFYTVAGTVGNAIAVEAMQDLPSVANPTAVPALSGVVDAVLALSLLGLVVAVVGGVAGLVVRWRRSNGDERQQIRWFLAGTVPVLVPTALHDAFPVPAGVVSSILLALIPLAIGIAVLRYRLYDLDLVLNRALVYTALSAITAAVYLSIVVLAQLVAGWGRGLGVQVAATVVAAALFQPLRTRIQGAVDRLLYGDRARPYEVLTRLAGTLERAAAPDAILAGVVTTVSDTLKVPYVAVEFALADGAVLTAAEHGNPNGPPSRFPMVYQDETIGHLLVSRRGPREEFDATDRRLLADLARQAGVAAHASRITAALQQARLALVTAREEERRRLRRDLHDGLGPALAGVTLGLHAALATVRVDADRAVDLLADLEAQVEEAVRDIRRLVYGLRPPALDEYGLQRALLQYAARIEAERDLSVRIEAPPDGLGALPAAVEVAAYRIATEAITNVARHARARSCVVQLGRDAALHLEIADDGGGLAAGADAGVGLTAMRERAAELGGDLRISSSPAGTIVSARLPIPEPT